MNQRLKKSLIPKTSRASRRMQVMLFLTLLAFAVLSFRLWTIQVLSHGDYKKLASINYVRQIPIPSMRGRILDRNGITLAKDELFYDIWVPILIVKKERAVTPEMDQTLSILATYLKLDSQTVEEYKAKLVDRYLNRPRDTYYKHARVRLEKEVHHSKVFPIYARQNIEFPPEAPVFVERVQKRNYPKQDLAAHVLGFTGEVSAYQLQSSEYSDYRPGDLIGKEGIEKQYETYLRGKEGIKQVFVDKFEIQRGEATILEKAEPGSNIMLNIDYDLQFVAEEALGASRGVIIVSDPRDNSILAMASNPRYNPNNYSQNLSRYESDPRDPLYHRAVLGTYEPGSVMKIFEVVALMEELNMPPTHTESCGGLYLYGGTSGKIHCHKRAGHGSVNLTDAVRRSCNIFFYKTVQDLGFERLYYWMTEFGFSNKTGIDLPYENVGKYPTMQNLHSSQRLSELIMLGIGQGSLVVSPLQIHTAVCAIANGGKLYPPRLAKKILPPDVIDPDAKSLVPLNESREPKTIEASPETWENVQHAMWEVVNNLGTGRRILPLIEREDFVAAGKTGTAQNSGPDTHAWFVCYGPFEDPTIAITVLVEHSGHGGDVASPLVAPIINEYLESPAIASR